jgi:hypothetical protein
MAQIDLTFENPLPEGIQVGDIAWYLDTSSNVEIKMGPIIAISDDPISIVVNAAVGVVPPDIDDFVFYAQDPIAVVSSLKGYFAEAQFINKSTQYAELFSIGAEIFESSK